MSPILFILYVNDLPINPTGAVQVSQFADDLGLWTTNKRNCKLEEYLQVALNTLEKWCLTWRIKLNTKKSQLITFSKTVQPSNIRVTLFGDTIKQEKTAKLLGITLDTKLTFEVHIQELTKKVNRKIWQLSNIEMLDARLTDLGEKVHPENTGHHCLTNEWSTIGEQGGLLKPSSASLNTRLYIHHRP